MTTSTTEMLAVGFWVPILHARSRGMTPSLDPSALPARDFPRDNSPRHPPLPKIEFPKFDGDNPRLWRDRYEMFFEVYSVGNTLKTRFAALNFSGPAAIWLQTFERKGRVLDWEEFCAAVFAHFDKDQY